MFVVALIVIEPPVAVCEVALMPPVMVVDVGDVSNTVPPLPEFELAVMFPKVMLAPDVAVNDPALPELVLAVTFWTEIVAFAWSLNNVILPPPVPELIDKLPTSIVRLDVRDIVPPFPEVDVAEIMLLDADVIALVKLEGLAVMVIVPPVPLPAEAVKLPASTCTPPA